MDLDVTQTPLPDAAPKVEPLVFEPSGTKVLGAIDARQDIEKIRKATFELCFGMLAIFIFSIAALMSSSVVSLSFVYAVAALMAGTVFVWRFSKLSRSLAQFRS